MPKMNDDYDLINWNLTPLKLQQQCFRHIKKNNPKSHAIITREPVEHITVCDLQMQKAEL